jgi:hypothetical protein
MNTGLEIDTNARTETGNVIKNMELRAHFYPERSKLNCLYIIIFPFLCVCVCVCSVSSSKFVLVQAGMDTLCFHCAGALNIWEVSKDP